MRHHQQLTQSGHGTRLSRSEKVELERTSTAIGKRCGEEGKEQEEEDAGDDEW